MYLALVTSAGAGVLLFLALQWLPRAPEAAAQRTLAVAQLQQYQAFLFAARGYFAQTAPPSVTTVYGWTTLRAGAVPSMAQAGMPPHWKAVRRPDGEWVACTELAESALGAMPALYPAPDQQPASGAARLLPLTIPAGSISVVIGTGGGSQPGTPSYVVLGQQGAEAADSANLCAGT